MEASILLLHNPCRSARVLVWALGAGLSGYFGKCLGKSWRFWFGLGDLVSSCFELNLRQVPGLSVWWVSAKWLRHGSPRAGS
ncbi:unnamed protein product [Prunus armeniaca]